MDKTMETLIPSNSELTINNKKYTIGKLTVSQLVKLTRRIIMVVAKMSEGARKELASGKSNIDDVTMIFEKLDDGQIADIIGIIINESDIEWLKTHLDVQVVSEIIALLVEKNDFGKIWGNVQRVMKGTGNQTSSSPSLK